MTGTHEKFFDIKVKLRMFDYFRYYFSLLNLKASGLIINILSAIILTIYFLSFVSLVYLAFATGVFNLSTLKGMVIDLVVMILFSTPYIRTYLIALKDAKTHKFLDKVIDIRITENKLIVSPEASSIEYSWKKMYKLYDFYHGFVLFIDNKELVFVLPRRCFSNKEQIGFVKDIILKYKK